MGQLATCDFLYTKDLYAIYYRRSGKKVIRILGVISIALLLPLCVLCLAALPSNSDPVFAVLTILLVALTAVMFWLAIKTPMRVPGYMYDSFCSRHGIDGDQTGFREHVDIDLDGITVASGPAGCEDCEMHPISKTWDEWKEVVDTPEVIMVIGKGGDPARNEDAMIPKASLQGMSPDALTAEMRDRIAAAG